VLDTTDRNGGQIVTDPERRQPPDALVGGLLLAVMLAFCALYYGAFTVDLDSYDAEVGRWQAALNADHEVYAAQIEHLRDGDLVLSLGNDVGIAALYLALSSILPGDYKLISLIVNCLVLCACYVVYARICDQLGLGMTGKLTFFANLYFIYFAQLINKDLFTVLAFLLTLHFGLEGRLRPMLLLVPFLLLVRIQLATFVLVFAFFMKGGARPWLRIALVYVVTSIVAGLLSALTALISEESLGSGLSAWLVEFNAQYYVGYLLLNPVRVVQYVADTLSSFAFVSSTGAIDVAKILRVPEIGLLLLLIRPLSTLVTRFSDWLDTPARPLVLTVLAYLIVWLMNPTVNARYFIVITPVLMLFALFARAATPSAAAAPEAAR
jgi:hypothetical protein